MFDFTREQTTRSVEQSLERLGVEYIDLIQVLDHNNCGILSRTQLYHPSRFTMSSFVTTSVSSLTSRCPRSSR